MKTFDKKRQKSKTCRPGQHSLGILCRVNGEVIFLHDHCGFCCISDSNQNFYLGVKSWLHWTRNCWAWLLFQSYWAWIKHVGRHEKDVVPIRKHVSGWQEFNLKDKLMFGRYSKMKISKICNHIDHFKLFGLIPF